jgi:predicted TPR repeat methyltransferase
MTSGGITMAAKCGVCESLSAGHVEAVIQQLHEILKLDRALRFGGDIAAASLAVTQAQERTLEAWVSFSGHFGQHAN